MSVIPGRHLATRATLELPAGFDANASLIIGSGHPSDLPSITVNLGTEMVHRKAAGPVQRLLA